MSEEYIPPEEVHSPKRNWKQVDVLYDEGKGKAAVALGRWGGDSKPCIAMRWNGSEANRIGNPQSRGKPTWFIVPDHFQEAVIERLPEEKITLARNFLKRKK